MDLEVVLTEEDETIGNNDGEHTSSNDRVKQMANFFVLLHFPMYSPLKARIALRWKL
jgi:hypothetical protein